jgi:biotin carboxylase
LLFFVEATTTGAGLTMLKSLTASGRRTAFITSKLSRYANSPGREALETLRESGLLFEVLTTDDCQRLDSLSHVLSPGEPVGVVASGDHYLPYTAALARDLHAPFLTPEAVAILRDKRRARRLYDELEIGNVRWADVPTPEALARFVDEIQGPVVIKNVRGTGSQDAVIARSADAAVSAWAELSSRARYLNGDLMVEEYVQGPLVSFEAVVASRTLIGLGFTDRQLSAPPTVAEIGYTFPAAVGQQNESAMYSAVETITTALEVEQGVFHAEFVLTPRGPHLIEVNARVPGALVTYMLRDCLDGDYYSLVADAAVGRRCAPVQLNGLSSSGYIAYAPLTGRAAADSDIAAAAGYPWVTDVLGGVRAGDLVGPPSDYRGSVGHVRTVAPTGSLSFAAARAAAQLLVPALRQTT